MQTRMLAMLMLAACTVTVRSPSHTPRGPRPAVAAAVAQAVASGRPCITPTLEHVSFRETAPARNGQLLPIEVVTSSGGRAGHFKLTLLAPAGSLGMGGDPMTMELDITARQPKAVTVNIAVATSAPFQLTAHLERMEPAAMYQLPAEYSSYITPTTAATPTSLTPDSAPETLGVSGESPPMFTLASGERVAVLISPAE